MRLTAQKLTKSQLSLRELAAKCSGSCLLGSSPEFCSAFSGTPGHVFGTIGSSVGGRGVGGDRGGKGTNQGKPPGQEEHLFLCNSLFLLKPQYFSTSVLPSFSRWLQPSVPFTVLSCDPVLLVLLFLHFTVPARHSAHIMKHFLNWGIVTAKAVSFINIQQFILLYIFSYRKIVKVQE